MDLQIDDLDIKQDLVEFIKKNISDFQSVHQLKTKFGRRLYEESKIQFDIIMQGSKVSSVENVLLGCLDNAEKKRKFKDYFIKNNKSVKQFMFQYVKKNANSLEDITRIILQSQQQLFNKVNKLLRCHQNQQNLVICGNYYRTSRLINFIKNFFRTFSRFTNIPIIFNPIYIFLRVLFKIVLISSQEHKNALVRKTQKYKMKECLTLIKDQIFDLLIY